MQIVRRAVALAFVLLLAAFGTAFLIEGGTETSVPGAGRVPQDGRASSLSEQSADRTAGQTVRETGSPAQPGSEELIAMAVAYPDRITDVEIVAGEWAVRMDDEWYYWSSGRLLPEQYRHQAEEFVGLRFYRYETGPFRPRDISPELAERLEIRTAAQQAGQTDSRERFNSFLDTLYQISSQSDADHLVQGIRFLGLPTRVHPLLVEPLRRVEANIERDRQTDPEVRRFLDGLHSAHGYNWRNIAGTRRRSYHSYGVAIDLVPKNYGGTWPYWLWAAQGGIERWWELPSESRWPVPYAVVRAFEEEGFIWGGKWLSFDNLHFEYRPEALLLAEWRNVARSGGKLRQAPTP